VALILEIPLLAVLALMIIPQFIQDAIRWNRIMFERLGLITPKYP